jgi:two-component system OmpR family sensor kinase
VRRLQAAARKVADGNFETTIPVASVGQLAPLARTFNEMQRRLAELDIARKQFIANASHELRTPIFSLGGFVELLEEEDPSPAEREEFVRTMRQQIERLTKLTTDLLDLSQLDAGAMVMTPDGVDLGELAREAAREFGPRAEAHGSPLRLRTADRPVIATADRERVRQIIRILLDNALTHTPEGTEIAVTVNRSSTSRRAELIVSDQGEGIPQRVQGRIFERFYTGDSSGGSGLGLAIATELAQRMDGSIAISSSRRFTAFTLELPPGRAAEPTPGRPLAKVTP